MYRYGKGVPQDDAEAAKWFRMAAEQGHAKAQLELDKMKEEATGMDMLMGSRDVSLNELIGEDTENINMKSLAFEGENQEESLINNEERNLFKQNITAALSGLNEKEAYIIINRVMADYPETLQEISDKYNITQERARQIEKQALKKMQQALPYLKE
jgi:RNA polymerase sigma-32 factor